MREVDFTSALHTSSRRDYLARVNEADKAECAIVAKKFAADYWDGERKYGYGGYQYDGRWLVVAEKMANFYNLRAGDKVLDVGCGKGFLLYELTKVVPGLIVAGIDKSEYAIANTKVEIQPYLTVGLAQELPYKDKEFDLVYSITTLHNLYIYELKQAVEHINRVSKQSWINVESYRNEHEKANLLYWQLTCEAFFTPQEWCWLFNEWHYTGDYSFIYFD